MRFTSAIRFITEQLSFEFIERLPVKPAALAPEPVAPEPQDDEAEASLPSGPAPELEQECRQLLLNLGLESATELVSVHWNPALRSTAGYARYPSWKIELNPRLLAFEGQVDRTLKHELAHLVAYHRSGRRIKPHGPEWQKACSDLGIRGEPAHHRLPLPRNRMERQLAYQCPSCRVVVRRVRPFRRATACLACCRLHAGGHFDARFKFESLKTEA